jgi:hypothetical protein
MDIKCQVLVAVAGVCVCLLASSHESGSLKGSEAEQLRQHGFVLLKGLVSESDVMRLKHAVERSTIELESFMVDTGQLERPLRYGNAVCQKHPCWPDVVAFEEICDRGQGRFEIRHNITYQLGYDDIILKNKRFAGFASDLFDGDYGRAFQSAIISYPGAELGYIHSDGGHVFSNRQLPGLVLPTVLAFIRLRMN